MDNSDKNLLLSFNLVKNVTDSVYFKTLYSLSNNYINNYRVIKIIKKNGKLRTIYVPSDILKEVQRNILHNILEKMEVSFYARAYKKGVFLFENAVDHVNKRVIVKLDIYKFFDNITFEHVYNIFIKKYSKKISVLLASLCTYTGFLPQGTPTASYLSNLILKDFDFMIGTWCETKKISYTRYSDDMTFSGDFDVSVLIQFVKGMLKKYGFRLNREKVHIVSNGKCQCVTGLVVNDKVNVKREYRNFIRKEMYYIKKYGLDSHLSYLNIKDKALYLQSLLGRINFVYSVTKSDLYYDYREYILKLKNEV